MTLLFDYIFRLGRPEGHAELGIVTSWLLGSQKLRSKVAQNYRKNSSFTRSCLGRNPMRPTNIS